MKSHVQHALRINADYIRELVEPIDPATYADMPRTSDGVALNPTAWLVPHMAVALSYVATLLGGEHTVPESWPKRYGMNTTATDKVTDYPLKEEALRILDKTVDAVIAGLDQATDAQLAATTAHEEFRKLVPTVGDAVVFLALTHTATHTGQLLSWRRCKGFGPRF